jgi:putative transposase
MRIAGLQGVYRRRSVRTTFPDRSVTPHPAMVQRNFKPTTADLLWVAHITYIPTWAGFLYLAIVIDAYSRKVIGWRMGENFRAELVVEALNMAIHNRRPKHSIDDLSAVAAALNTRPRKTLGWKTPAKALNEHLLSCQKSTVATIP